MGFTTTPHKPASVNQQANLVFLKSPQPWFSTERATADGRTLSHLVSGNRERQVEAPRLALDIHGNEVTLGNSSIVGRLPMRMSGKDEDPPADVIPLRNHPALLATGEFEQLLKLLQSEEDEDIIRAARRLAATRDPRAIEPLIGALCASQYDAIIPEVAQALVSYGKSAVELLIARISSEKMMEYEDWIDHYAVFVLGEIGDSRALEPLLSRLDVLNDNCSHDEPYTHWGLDAVMKIYEAAGEEKGIRDRIVDALSTYIEGMIHGRHRAPDDYLPPVIATLGKLNPSSCVDSICKGLADIEDDNWLDDSDHADAECFAPEIIQASVAGLAAYGSIMDMVPFLLHPSYILQVEISKALQSPRSPKFRDRDLRKIEDAPVDIQAIGTLIAARNMDVPALEIDQPLRFFMTMLDSEVPQVRIAATVALGEWGDYSGLSPLLKLATEDEHASVRQAALMALQKIQEK